ncbi:MAG TPA: hypothetical protein PLR83_00225 [Pyrinomonadaceae bacterium]|nr:hypothetical protein [Pyrinomonadaceae bacterium]
MNRQQIRLLTGSLFDTISPASIPAVTATRIVCGDCAGDETLPRKTMLTADGRCAECGGRSYIPASVIGIALGKTLRDKTPETTYDYTTTDTTDTNRRPVAEPQYPQARIWLVGSGSR